MHVYKSLVENNNKLTKGTRLMIQSFRRPRASVMNWTCIASSSSQSRALTPHGTLTLSLRCHGVQWRGRRGGGEESAAVWHNHNLLELCHPHGLLYFCLPHPISLFLSLFLYIFFFSPFLFLSSIPLAITHPHLRFMIDTQRGTRYRSFSERGLTS